MTPAKVFYYERASVFDRMLVVLLGLACIYLVSMKDDCPPCAEQDRLMTAFKITQENPQTHLHREHDVDYNQKNSKTYRRKTTVKKAIKKIPKKSKSEVMAEDDLKIPKDSLWVNKHDIVHIMTTRYMQLQPDLIHLGRARNDLFRTFTLPSVVGQTTQEFIWIIFTDPDLHADDVLEMIKPYKNILLLGMNNGLNNFRTTGWMQNIKTVFSGDLQMLKDYRQAAKSRVLLETRIDADDSIFVGMMDSVQRQAAATLGERAKEHNYDATKIKKEYRIFCTEHHLEWGYFNPWEKTSSKGHLFGISHEEFCISAGLTYGLQIGTSKDDLPTTSHHKMGATLPKCQHTHSKNCVERIDAGDYKYAMLRSRTPTSAGMQGVIPIKEVVNSEVWKKRQDWAWMNVIEQNFAVAPDSIFALRKKLKKNMIQILTDALKGQCTKAEFTCKDTSKQTLTNLLKEVDAHS